MTFYIQSVTTGLVLDIKEGRRESGTEIIMYPYNGATNQMWEFRNGMIVSRHNGLAIDINEGRGRRLNMWAPHGGVNQIWFFDSDNTIRSAMGYVMDVKDAHHGAHASVIAYQKHGGHNQKFRMVYC